MRYGLFIRPGISKTDFWSRVNLAVRSLRFILNLELERFSVHGTDHTVEPRFTDSSLIRTPRYYKQFSLSLGKALTFSLNSTLLIRTPLNVDNGLLFLAKSTDSHRKSTSQKRTLLKGFKAWVKGVFGAYNWLAISSLGCREQDGFFPKSECWDLLVP